MTSRVDWDNFLGFELLMVADLEKPVLVIEEIQAMGQIIRSLLKRFGFRYVDAIPDSGAALVKLRGRDYGLVICNWNIHPMSGFNLLKEIRADPTLKFIPFIMMSASATQANVLAAKSAGANNYIVKPFSEKMLREKINQVFPATL